MTNKERQKTLDSEKWIQSECERTDLSGAMEYCEFCDAQNGAQCAASQSEREAFCHCAKAYNKMVKNCK